MIDAKTKTCGMWNRMTATKYQLDINDTGTPQSGREHQRRFLPGKCLTS